MLPRAPSAPCILNHQTPKHLIILESNASECTVRPPGRSSNQMLRNAPIKCFRMARIKYFKTELRSNQRLWPQSQIHMAWNGGRLESNNLESSFVNLGRAPRTLCSLMRLMPAFPLGGRPQISRGQGLPQHNLSTGPT